MSYGFRVWWTTRSGRPTVRAKRREPAPADQLRRPTAGLVADHAQRPVAALPLALDHVRVPALLPPALERAARVLQERLEELVVLHPLGDEPERVRLVRDHDIRGGRPAASRPGCARSGRSSRTGRTPGGQGDAMPPDRRTVPFGREAARAISRAAPAPCPARGDRGRVRARHAPAGDPDRARDRAARARHADRPLGRDAARASLRRAPAVPRRPARARPDGARARGSGGGPRPVGGADAAPAGGPFRARLPPVGQAPARRPDAPAVPAPADLPARLLRADGGEERVRGRRARSPTRT